MAVDFPYWKLTLPSFRAMFQTLASEAPVVTHRAGRNYEWVLARRYPDDHRRVDGISNHFTEEERVAASFGDQPTPAENHRAYVRSLAPKDLAKYLEASPEAKRELVYGLGRECNTFNPALAKLICEKLGGYRPVVIDPSAGWGDRAIAAAAAGAKAYLGCDPNPFLRPKYEALARALAAEAPGTEVRIATSAGEDHDFAAGGAHLAVTSPPYFTLERYVLPELLESNSQSIERYPLFDDWVAGFLRPYYANAYQGLCGGGWLVIYITDVRLPGGEACPLAKESWAILRELGALEGPVFNLVVASDSPAAAAADRRVAAAAADRGAPAGPERGRRRPRRADRPAERAPPARPARAWLRPPEVVVELDHPTPAGPVRALRLRTTPPQIDTVNPVRLKGDALRIFREDRQPYGSAGRAPHLFHPGHQVCGWGGAGDPSLALLARLAHYQKTPCTLFVYGSMHTNAPNMCHAMAYEARVIPCLNEAAAAAAAVNYQAPAPVQVFPPGLVGETDLPTYAGWLAPVVENLAAPAGQKEATVWLFWWSDQLARALLLARPGLHLKVMWAGNRPPARDGVEFIGKGSPADLRAAFLAEAAAGDVLWMTS